jgi:hypothetical protein
MNNETQKFYEGLIIEAYYLLDPDKFDDWIEKSFKVSSPMNPDGIFYTIEEMKEYCGYS